MNEDDLINRLMTDIKKASENQPTHIAVSEVTMLKLKIGELEYTNKMLRKKNKKLRAELKNIKARKGE